MREKKDEKQTAALPFYESHPPSWLPEIHGSGDLGLLFSDSQLLSN
jgi:mediator of RNA polymerase II transcription subunit 12